MKRIIATGSGSVTIGAYVAAWKRVKASPPGTEFKSSLCGRWAATREEILQQFSDGVNDRVNLRGKGLL